MSLTKEHLIRRVSGVNGLPKKKSRQLVESMLEILKSTLESCEDVLISGFGRFSVLEKGARRGRNPQTGNSLVLDARRVVTFKCSGVLREKMNGKGHDPK